MIKNKVFLNELLLSTVGEVSFEKLKDTSPSLIRFNTSKIYLELKLMFISDPEYSTLIVSLPLDLSLPEELTVQRLSLILKRTVLNF